MTPPAVATRLFLARHADVHNPDGVLYGHLPGFRLSEKGVRQAHVLGRRIAATGEPVRQVVTSPLQRARETADIIASYLDGVAVTETADLVEARFGLYLQGVRPRDVIWRRPLWLVHMARPGLLRRDESVARMAARVRAPLLRALRDSPGQSAVMVSHGDPIQAYWVESDGRSPYALHRLQCLKGGMLVLDFEGERLVQSSYVPPSEAEPVERDPAVSATGTASEGRPVSSTEASTV